MSQKSEWLPEPSPQSPKLGDFEQNLAQKSPNFGGLGGKCRTYDTFQTSFTRSLTDLAVICLSCAIAVLYEKLGQLL